MLTKYILTIGSTEHEIPDECLKNWDDISFSLKRTDYSGVMRSFSTEFEFVGDIKDLLWELYLAEGFHASASVAVYTITNNHEWAKQFEAALDFSTVSVEDGSLSINSIDNALASLIKSKKSQKYEFPVGDFDTTSVVVDRIELKNYATFTFLHYDIEDLIDLYFNDDTSAIISKEYFEMSTQAESNSFFAHCLKHGPDLRGRIQGTVRCYLNPRTPWKNPDGTNTQGGDVPVGTLEIWVDYQLEDENFHRVWTSQFDDDIMYKVIRGSRTGIFVNFDKANVFSTLEDLIEAAETRYGEYGRISTDYNGIFGVVGEVTDYSSTAYWTDNSIYEYLNGYWIYKGAPADYFQDRPVDEMFTISADYLWNDTHVRMKCDKTMTLLYGTLYVEWADPIRNTLVCRGISPVELITKVVRSITGEQTVVSIAADDGGLLADTLLVAGEELRHISDAKIYTTFGNFADWMEAVFGYTYRIVGEALQFVHRSAVFADDVVKVIDGYRDFKYEVVDDLIYSQVDAGYSKKEYSEIDGRYETNFTNYYSTGYSLTDKKLSLMSKYRSDRYGVEFTARKSESESKDDKADEDVFFLKIERNATSGSISYTPSDQEAFAPSVCVENNKGFIAALGNGAAVTLTMTSSDGDNVLDDVEIDAGDNLFTAGEVGLTTDDMELPSNLNALVQVDHDGHRYTGFIKEADARFGRQNGVEYRLIVKEIEEL